MKISINTQIAEKDTISERALINISGNGNENEIYQVVFMLMTYIENQLDVTTFYSYDKKRKISTITIFRWDDYGVQNRIKNIDQITDVINGFMNKYAIKPLP